MWHIDEDVAVSPAGVHAAASAFDRADAVLLTFEPPVPTIRETINMVSRCQARVFLQPAPVLAEPAAAAALPWDEVDVLVPNEIEAQALLNSGEGGRNLAADGLADALADELRVPTVVVTLGESGCIAHTAGVTHRYSAQQTVAVDTTGASDAFTATFAAHLTAGAFEADAVHAAQSAAAWAIGHPGGHRSMPAPG